MKNPKTTIIGILLIVGTLCGVGVQLLRGEPVDLQAILATIVSGLVGIGLIAAKDASTKCLLPVLLIPAFLVTGCVTVRTIDDTGAQTVTTRADVDAILVCTQLIMTNAPTAFELVTQIQDALAKPEGPNKTDELLALLEQARVLIETYNANRLTGLGPFLTLRPDGSVR